MNSTKLKNNQCQIEKFNNIENKIKINKIKQNIIRELSKVNYTDINNRAPLENDKL